MDRNRDGVASVASQREVLTSFLQSGNSAEAAAGIGGSDQILGILETMLEEMQRSNKRQDDLRGELDDAKEALASEQVLTIKAECEKGLFEDFDEALIIETIGANTIQQNQRVATLFENKYEESLSKARKKARERHEELDILRERHHRHYDDHCPRPAAPGGRNCPGQWAVVAR